MQKQTGRSPKAKFRSKQNVIYWGVKYKVEKVVFTQFGYLYHLTGKIAPVEEIALTVPK